MKNKSIKKIKRTAYFYFDHVNNRVALQTFLDWIKECLPANKTEDPTIELAEEFDLNGDVICSSIKLSWKEKC
jgi:hypothetical protein